MEKAKAKPEMAAKPRVFRAQDAPVLQSHVKHAKSTTQRKWFVDVWFRFLLQQHKADEVLESGFAKSLLSLHFVIILISTAQLNWMLLSKNATNALRDTLFQSFQPAVNVALLTISAAMILLSCACLLEMPKTTSAPSLAQRSLGHLKYIQWYIILPVSCSVWSGGLLSSVVLCIAVCVSLFLQATFSGLPTHNKFAASAKFAEGLISIGTSIAIMLAGVEGSVLNWVSLGIQFLCILASWQYQIFWWYHINTWYNSGLLATFLGRLVLRILPMIKESPSAFEYLLYTAIFLALVSRVGTNLSMLRLTTRIRRCHTASLQENYILYFTYELCRQAEDDRVGSGQIPKNVLFSMQQIGRLSLYNAQRRQELVNARKNSVAKRLDLTSAAHEDVKQLKEMFESEAKDPLYAFFHQAIVRLRPNSFEDLFLLAVLQLVFLGKSIMSISNTLALCRKLLGDNWYLSFDLYLMEELFQGRLEHLSIEDSSTEHFSRTSLSEVLSEVSKDLAIIQEHLTSGAYLNQPTSKQIKQLQTGSSATNNFSLDLSQVLKCKQSYIQIVSQINKLVNMKTEIFSTLFEKRIHKSHFLFKSNEIAHKHAAQLDSAFTKLLATELVGNYVLSCGVAYFLKIRYDFRRSEAIFKIYKNRLSRYVSISNSHLKGITIANFQYNSVVLRVNLGQDSSLGMLTELSPNFADHLGVPENGEPTSVNLNNLFPAAFSQSHRRMMAATSDQPVFNNQQDFHLNGFDGYLRPVRYIVKLDLQIGAGLHAVALVRVDDIKDKTLLMVSQKMQIMSADGGFWKMMETFQLQPEDLPAISNLSDTVPIFLNLLRFLKMKETFVNTDSETAGAIGLTPSMLNQQGSQMNSSLAAEYSRQLTKMLTLNQLKLRLLEYLAPYEKHGVLHWMREDIGMAETLTNQPILVASEEKTFGKEPYFVLTIKFDAVHLQENNFYWDMEEIKDSSFQLSGSQRVDPEIFRLTDSVSKDDTQEQDLAYTVSEKSEDSVKEVQRRQSKQYQPQTIQQSQLGVVSFEKLMWRAKEQTPLMQLLQEVTDRKYSEDIEESLKWIREFLASAGEDKRKNRQGKGSPNSKNRNDVMKHTTTDSSKNKTSKYLKSAFKKSATAAKIKIASARTDEMMKKSGDEVRNSNPDLPMTGRSDGIPSQVENSLTVRDTNLNREVPKEYMNSNATIQTSFFQPKSMQGSKMQRNKSPGGYDSSIGASKIQSQSENYPVVKIIRTEVSKISRVPEKVSNIRAKVIQSNMRKLNSTKLLNFKTFGSSRRGRKNPDSKQGKGQDPKDTSVEDNKTIKSSVFSQLARSLFKFRGQQQDATGKTSAILENQEDLTPAAITKLAGDNALISHNPANIQLITKYISDYKLIRKSETNPDEKNGSSIGSNKTSSSRGSYYLKMVNTVMDTNKGGSSIYLYTVASVFFSLYFVVILQVVFNSLKSYNVSNLNNFILLSNFLALDKSLLDSCEAQELAFLQLQARLTNNSLYAWMASSYRSAGLSADPFRHSQDRLSGSVGRLAQSVKLVSDQTINMLYKQDAGDVVAATYRKEQLNYTDRFIENATIYKPWDMPYFATIIYYMNSLGKNKEELSAVGARPLDSGMLAAVNNSRKALSAAVFGAVIDNMPAEFTSQIRKVITLGVDKYFYEVYFMLYVSVAVAVVLFWYIIFAGFKINLMQRDYLMNYNMLRPWELFIMIEDLMRSRVVFTRYTFNEAQLLSEYLDFNLYSALSSFSSRVNKLQEQFYKDKERAARIKKFRHDFLFFSSKFLLIFILFTGLVFGVMGLVIYLFLRANDNRIGVEMLLFDSHIHMVGIMKSYLSMTLLQIYGYFLPIAGTPSNTATKRADAFQNFLAFMNSKKSSFEDYFGGSLSNDAMSLVFSDMCSFVNWDATLSNQYSWFIPDCYERNSKSATRGILGFLQYQTSLEEILRQNVLQNYSLELAASTASPISQPLLMELFSKPQVELRTASWVLLDVFYTVLRNLSIERVQQIKTNLEYVVSQVMQGVSVGLYLLLCVVYVFAFRQQAYEIQICYETFRLIDPFFLMNNRYLQHRFKAAYRGVD